MSEIEVLTVENPIPSRVRGWVFVTGIVLSTSATTAAAVAVAVQEPVIGSIIGIVGNAVAALSQMLARANLTPDSLNPVVDSE